MADQAVRAVRRCLMPDCDRRAAARGYCRRHYQRLWRHGDPRVMRINRYAPGTLCAAPGCERPVRAKGLCPAHYYRQKRTGDVGTLPIGTGTGWLPQTAVEEAVRRVRRGESRRHVAAALGISPSAVWGFVSGRRRAGALSAAAPEKAHATA